MLMQTILIVMLVLTNKCHAVPASGDSSDYLPPLTADYGDDSDYDYSHEGGVYGVGACEECDEHGNNCRTVACTPHTRSINSASPQNRGPSCHLACREARDKCDDRCRRDGAGFMCKIQCRYDVTKCLTKNC